VDDAGNKDGIVEISDFDEFYKKRQLEPVRQSLPPNAQVALFADGLRPTHAARKTGVACGGWESKMGGGARIAHFLNQLEGGEYGNIDRYYVPMGTYTPKGPNQSTE
jgi:hypothetical protein